MSTAVVERSGVEEQRARFAAILRDPNAKPEAVVKAKVGMIETARTQIAAACPPGVDGNQVVDYAIQVLREDQKLLPCTITSLMISINRAAMCGLRLGGLRPEAYLVPIPVYAKKPGQQRSEKVRTDANMWPSYHGWIKLVRNTGRLQSEPIVCCVYAGEDFKAELTDGVLRISHSANALNPARRSGDDSKIEYVWVRWQLDTGPVDVLLSREEIEAHKDQYSKKPQYGEWNWETKWREMAEKTVIIHSVRRRHVPMRLEAAGMGLLEDEPETAVTTVDIEALAVIDGECHASEVEEEQHPEQEAKAAVDSASHAWSPEVAFDRYVEELAKATDIKAAGEVYDRWFSPSAPHKWTSEHEAAGARAFGDRKDELRKS